MCKRDLLICFRRGGSGICNIVKKKILIVKKVIIGYFRRWEGCKWIIEVGVYGRGV